MNDAVEQHLAGKRPRASSQARAKASGSDSADGDEAHLQGEPDDFPFFRAQHQASTWQRNHSE